MDQEKFLDWVVWAIWQGKQKRRLSAVSGFRERFYHYRIDFLTFQSSKDKGRYIDDFLGTLPRLITKLVEKLVSKTKSLIKKVACRISFLQTIMRKYQKL